jgi:hypothetical protein
VSPVVSPKSKKGKQTYRNKMKGLRISREEKEMERAEIPVDTLGFVSSSPMPPIFIADE